MFVDVFLVVVVLCCVLFVVVLYFVMFVVVECYIGMWCDAVSHIAMHML